MSTSWNVVSMAAVFWLSFRRSAMRWRMRFMGTRVSVRAPAAAAGAASAGAAAAATAGLGAAGAAGLAGAAAASAAGGGGGAVSAAAVVAGSIKHRVEFSTGHRSQFTVHRVHTAHSSTQVNHHTSTSAHWNTQNT